LTSKTDKTAHSSAPALLMQVYDAMVRGKEIADDPAQRHIISALEALRMQVVAISNASLLSRIFKSPAPINGLYIWGNVGRGKSMLMDIFYNNVPIEAKRRVHFHAFMQEVHDRIHALRQDGQRGQSGADPVIMLAKQIAAETMLLCFDELQATDVADATLLYRLFSSLFEAGVIIVSTTNRPPETLYTGGVQAERFGKFIALLHERMQVVSLDSVSDYRLLQRKSVQQVYHWPLQEAESFLKKTISELAQGQPPEPASLLVKGRTLTFTSYSGDIACFTFSELCEKPLGPADYLAIAERFDTVILTGIPQLSAEKRNEAKRFVTLVDALYEKGVRLICTAAVPPDQIYHSGDGSFEFHRTVSRLMEMQSARYLQAEKPVASA